MANGLSLACWQLITLIISSILVLGRTDIESAPRLEAISDDIHVQPSASPDGFRRVLFNVRGRSLRDDLEIRATTELPTGSAQCRGDLTLKVIVLSVFAEGSAAHLELYAPGSFHGKVYFCLSPQPVAGNENGELIYVDREEQFHWHHQGADIYIKIPSEVTKYDLHKAEKRLHPLLGRSRRDDPPAVTDDEEVEEIRVHGLRIDYAGREPHLEGGIPVLQVNIDYTLRLFGWGFTRSMLVVLTKKRDRYGGPCQYPVTKEYTVDQVTFEPETVQLTIQLPPSESHENFYLCLKEPDPPDISTASPSTLPHNSTHRTQSSAITHTVTNSRPYVHQGSATYTALRSFEKLIPLWAGICIIVVCLCFSALFSGLNLGLMSLDRTELRILCNTGTPQERMYAKMIQPVRDHGNYLLCSILLGNVFVNSIFTILLDDLTSGLVAVVCSTLLIVMFGEITPQAICSRHGLMIGARTICMTKLVMGLTFPLSYPISKILDLALGEEIGNVYNRERLKELVKVTTGENDLDRDEVNIISGALELRKKCVSDVMTIIEDAFMLDYDAVLDFETVSEIMKSGYSRIPVYEGDRKAIITTLFIKDLAFVDPDDNTPLKTLCQFYQNPCNFVFEDVTLDVMFKDFKGGNKGHMAFVNRVNSEGEGDPFYETIGLVTLEDVIEELIQAEIMDETDVFTDNRSKRRRNADRTKQDFTVFAERRGENNRIRISPQLTLATFQYLSTSVDQFKQPLISETILRRLLKQDIIYHIKKNKDWRNDEATVIYEHNKPVDYFVLILEGKVEVTVGTENLMFESGPFTFFGTQALLPNVGMMPEPSSTMGSLQSLNMDSMLRYTFQPDYSVRASTEVLYMKVKRSLYLAAKRASLMEKSQRDNPTTTGDQFDDEVEKCFDDDSNSFELHFEKTDVQRVEQLLHSLEDDSSIGRTSPINHLNHHHNNVTVRAVVTTAPVSTSQFSEGGCVGGSSSLPHITTTSGNHCYPKTVTEANGGSRLLARRGERDGGEDESLLPSSTGGGGSGGRS